jgi:LysM repeat protein
MKKFCLVLVCCLLFSVGVFAQIVPNQQQDEIKMAESGVFFSPMMQTLNLSLDSISFLRRQNKQLGFTISLANNTGVSLNFVSYASHINQCNGDFEAASILPDTEMYLITQEDANDPNVFLKRLAKENYSDENFFGAIARFNSLQQEYALPEEIFIPKVKQHTVQDGELLSDVAKLFYSDESKVDFLAQANGIVKPYQIFKEQIILVPEILESTIKSDSYKVSKGDTIKSIAEKSYGVESVLSGELLLVWHNSLKKEYIIMLKQVLAIPILLEKYQVQEIDTWEKISTKYYLDNSGSKMLETINQKLITGQEIFVLKIVKPEFSCAPWIVAKEKSFSLKPRESREVLFQVNLPRGGNLGGTYSAVVTLEQQNKVDDSGGGGLRTSINTAYNSVLIINVESRRPLVKTAELHSFEIQKKDGLTGLVFGLKNLGRTQIQVRKIELRVMQED